MDNQEQKYNGENNNPPAKNKIRFLEKGMGKMIGGMIIACLGVLGLIKYKAFGDWKGVFQAVALCGVVFYGWGRIQIFINKRKRKTR